MIGISVYLNEERKSQNAAWIEKAAGYGCKSIFTSLHIPEDDPSSHRELLMELGQLAKEFRMELLADISPISLHHLGLSMDSLPVLLEWGLSGIRADYGFTPAEIIGLSHVMKVGINASTISESDIDEWIKNGLHVQNVEAWHNFYPRPETGLDKEFLIQRNRLFQLRGISTMAFVPGNGELRGPIHAGLPTLEKHRGMNPFAAAAELFLSAETDKVLIGDHSAAEEQLQLLSIVENRIVPLRFSPSIPPPNRWLKQVHTNRMDPARDVIRSVESRSYAQMGDSSIQPENQQTRKKGAVTMDNELYGRYAGELQIALHDLPKDKRVNVLGHIVEEDLCLLPLIKAGQKFQLFVRDEE